jgi:hypothetical protein
MRCWVENLELRNRQDCSNYKGTGSPYCVACPVPGVGSGTNSEHRQPAPLELGDHELNSDIRCGHALAQLTEPVLERTLSRGLRNSKR